MPHRLSPEEQLLQRLVGHTRFKVLKADFTQALRNYNSYYSEDSEKLSRPFPLFKKGQVVYRQFGGELRAFSGTTTSSGPVYHSVVIKALTQAWGTIHWAQATIFLLTGSTIWQLENYRCVHRIK